MAWLARQQMNALIIVYNQVNTHNPETRFLQETGFLTPLERSPKESLCRQQLILVH
ncbi:hypothetical protein PN466_04030 [Roseofilum reptotaenium CS-1145]|nr:hypothetical protein [Roseofilum reptotaenium CS-1145]